MTASAACLHHDQPSPFTGADVCRLAGLGLPGDARRPVFEDDLWDFTDAIGLPVEMAPGEPAPRLRRDHRYPLAPGHQGAGAGHACPAGPTHYERVTCVARRVQRLR